MSKTHAGDVEKRAFRSCAVADGTIKTLGVSLGCEEVYEAEEDYWGWK